MGMGYTFGCNPVQKMWNRDSKTAIETFGRKRKSTEFIYLHRSNFREAEANLKTRSCLQDEVINFAPQYWKAHKQTVIIQIMPS